MRRSLRGRIALALSLTSAAIVLLCGWFFFVHARQVLVARTSETLTGVAGVVAASVPAERLESYVSSERAGNPDLTTRGVLLAQLQDAADRAGVDDLYLVDRGNRVVLDATRRLPYGEEDFALSLARAAVDRAWSDRGPSAARVFVRPEAGYRLAAFAPVLSPDGRMLALVGAEEALPGLAVTDALRDRFLLIAAGGVLLSLLAAAAVSQAVLRPVQRLVGGISERDPSGYPPPVPGAGSDEIGFLTRAFNRLIGELKAKDAELRALYGREKAQADLVLASVPTGVLGVDRERVVRLWNPAAATILGRDPEAALGRPARELSLPSSLVAALERALDGAASPPREATWAREAGARRLELAAVPYRDGSGELLGAVAVLTDVTDRARLEHELRVRERLAALGEMSSGIAHEVRNPLAAMQGFAELLARRGGEPSTTKLVDGLRREIEALNAIVTAFSRFARAPVLQRREVHLRALLEELLPYFEGRGVDVRLELDGVSPLLADPDEMRTVFANLLRNAVEAQPTGGAVEVTGGYDPARRVHVVRVADRGPGVPPELAGRIFNPFFTTKSDGTGMGLALVHRIVTAHGGTVRLIRGAGPGSVFEIELPEPGAGTGGARVA
ncbi:MAG: ATP-binding protein [Gemmatimonadota bacterium]